MAVQGDLPSEELGGTRNAVDHLQNLTGQLEVELQRLGTLAQSGQLLAEDRYEAGGYKTHCQHEFLPFGSGHDHLSVPDSDADQ